LKNILLIAFVFMGLQALGQENFRVSGKITSGNAILAYANVSIAALSKGATTDDEGSYEVMLPEGIHTLRFSFLGFKPKEIRLDITGHQTLNVDLEQGSGLDEVVVSGTLKAMTRSKSPVPVEIYSQSFLRENPTPNVFEALQNVNGVRPQINCNVCNTGDIHINGLEGPYTLVLIDGMPIVSGLSTVYGLSGIPNALIERVEVVKGPASSLYGTEAVGGLINIITKNPLSSDAVVADVMGSSWGEVNMDLSLKSELGDKAISLLGVNYFNYGNARDDNNDNFTDLTLQDRISVFNKWDFKRRQNKLFYLAGRFLYEDRWGGEMQWEPRFRGGDSIYGESIYTTRYELIGKYQLPVSEAIFAQFSYTDHDQNSVYGDVPYLARQRIGFLQVTWEKEVGGHTLLLGTAGRYNFYNDNTPATKTSDEVVIPSILVQDNWQLDVKNTLLLGARYDHDPRHGSIFTPRVAYKHGFNDDHSIRLNGGTGFRAVNLFTEDHAALTGSREVTILEDLRPERSFNVNLNYLGKIYFRDFFFTLEASAWYTHFSNAILPDYDTDPNKIIYKNLDGKAISKGVSVNLDLNLLNGFKGRVGATYQDVSREENGLKTEQVLTESFMGVWSLNYDWQAANLSIDYTGNAYGPMRLPLLGDLDPREEYSPLYSIQNIQITYKGFAGLEIYGGVKNLLNWTPNKNNRFIIARSQDPFDKNVQFDTQGNALSTADNPYALTFDPSYVYAPNQGIRGFLGLRYSID